MKAGSFTIMRHALCAVALSVAMGAWSAENIWRDTTGDHKWGTPGNWSLERCPIDGDTVTILEGMDAISVDNDSAASFASAITITQRTKLPITYVDIEATTNLTLHCVMSSYASFRLKSAIDVSAADTSQLNFQGFNILEKGRFLMPEGGSTRFDYGRFAVSNDAALVARRPTNHRLYQLYADGMVTNMNSEKATLTITMASSPISYIAGPLGGKWTVQPECRHYRLNSTIWRSSARHNEVWHEGKLRVVDWQSGLVAGLLWQYCEVSRDGGDDRQGIRHRRLDRMRAGT